jgi:protein TonB
MPEAAGFFEQKRGSPTGLVAVIAMHAAVLGALVLIKGPQIIREINPPLVITPIEIPDDPPPVAPVDPETPRRPQTVTRTETVIPRDFSDIIDRRETVIPTLPEQPRIELARVEPPLPSIRREAQLLSGDLQPPYPPSEERAQRGGTVQLRVTIGADGRVTGVQRIAATSDAFWRATERQALSRWRFRPATLDGRPVEASKVMTVTFRIQDI